MIPPPPPEKNSIGSGIGLAPNRWQAITWNNDDLVYWRIYVAIGEGGLINNEAFRSCNLQLLFRYLFYDICAMNNCQFDQVQIKKFNYSAVSLNIITRSKAARNHMGKLNFA